MNVINLTVGGAHSHNEGGDRRSPPGRSPLRDHPATALDALLQTPVAVLMAQAEKGRPEQAVRYARAMRAAAAELEGRLPAGARPAPERWMVGFFRELANKAEAHAARCAASRSAGVRI